MIIIYIILFVLIFGCIGFIFWFLSNLSKIIDSIKVDINNINKDISKLNEDIDKLKKNKTYFDTQVTDLNFKMKKTIDVLETFNNGFPVNQSYKY